MANETLESLLAQKDALEKLLDGFEKWVIFFGVLVVLGVGGEVIFGARTWWNNRKLHTVQESIDHLRQTEVQIAKKNAASALIAGEQLKHENLVLQADVLKLREKFSWRTISPEQHDIMRRTLSRFKGQRFDIDKALSDPESSQFSDEIRAALVAAEWIPHDMGGLVAGPVPTGVRIGVHRDSASLPSAIALVDLLESKPFSIKKLTVGWENQSGSPYPVAPGDIAIHVGRKPQ